MILNVPNDLLYSKEHEWIKIDDNEVIIGITDFAQSQLGDIIFLELPGIGDKIVKDQPFGEIEAVKTVSELFAPISGNVSSINEILEDSADKINNDCYGEGWIIKIIPDDENEYKDLLSNEKYTDLIN